MEEYSFLPITHLKKIKLGSELRPAPNDKAHRLAVAQTKQALKEITAATKTEPAASRRRIV